jgi:hypothetical protein
MTRQRVTEALARVLSVAGISAVYGRPLGALPVIEVDDTQVAVLLSVAHRAVNGAPAIAHAGDGELVVVGLRSAFRISEAGRERQAMLPVRRAAISDPAGLNDLGPQLLVALEGDGMRVRVDLEPESLVAGAPASIGALDDWPDPDPELVLDVSTAERLVVLVGPGVVRQRAVTGLHALAAAGRLGVLNTWGAKGVYHWRSRHHWATVGLQEWDFELGGLAASDLVLVSGVDEPEAPERFWSRYRHRVVAPEVLGPLAERLVQPGPFLDLPPLRERLAAVTQAGWAAGPESLAPSLVTRHYADALGRGGLVAADAGVAGYWVARTFPTTQLGTALVPSGLTSGWAAACVLVARLGAPLRPALAVVDGPVDPQTQGVLEEARRLGIKIGVESWQADGPALSPDAHRSRLQSLVGSSGATVALATDDNQLAEMIAVAGPLRAWTPESAST